MYTGKERRQNARYNAGSMSVSISYEDKSTGLRSIERVKAIDYNNMGLSIETNLVFNVGENISIDISHRNERLSGVIGLVCYVEEQEDTFRYGIQFDFGANEFMCSEQVETALEGIQHMMKRSQPSSHRAAYRRIKNKYR
ncbi:MAG: PilZ domain-containing protein [Proteobacteria bacterium]|nr:PilZ domain-containing protein [Pseudomonadota bacterium]